MDHYHRPAYGLLLSRLKEKRRFIQVVAGPRQIGKTTLVRQVIQALDIPTLYVSADEPMLQNPAWIAQQWEIARLKCKESPAKGALLVLDEIQKIPHWSDAVKRLWDEDTKNNVPLRVVILGSAPLLIQQGLTESLAGRFEIIPLTHWSYLEMKQAFGWSLDQFIYFGGYPGAADLIKDEERWRNYILNSLVETTISRDILLMTRVNKPALLRQLFQLGCQYSGQILSYQKMLGQLQDAGNTTTLAHYLELLSGVGMLTGLDKFAGNSIRQRSSSPKLQVLDTALISTQLHLSFNEVQQNPNIWGRLVESAVGAYLINGVVNSHIDVLYWREGNKEVDFVLRRGKIVTGIEIKSGLNKGILPGMETFAQEWSPKRMLLVGGQGLPLEEFFTLPVMELVS